MKKIVFITPSDARYGFRLAGVRQYIAGEMNFPDVLKKAVNEPDTGLIVIDERLTGGAEEELRNIERTWNGVLLMLPSPERPGIEVEDYAVRLIRRAIGYHVRLTI